MVQVKVYSWLPSHPSYHCVPARSQHHVKELIPILFKFASDLEIHQEQILHYTAVAYLAVWYRQLITRLQPNRYGGHC